MSTVRAQRWAVSFADLALLLLGFFVMMQVANGREATVIAATRAALDGGAAQAGNLLDRPADMLFEPGEARLRPAARTTLAKLGRAAARSGGRLQVESRGWPDGTARFDRWELAAARAAAVARALAVGGVGQDRIDIVVPRAPERKAAGHYIVVRRG